MRKPRDPSTSLRGAYDAELKALDDKARLLKSRHAAQLGELMIACGADTLPVEQLAGALLAAAENRDKATREAWQAKGAAFFRKPRATAKRAAGDGAIAAPDDGGAAPV
jgi:hypothetical protein